MNGYQFTLTCPYDGALIVPIAEGTSNGWTARAKAQCSDCGIELVVQVTLAFVADMPRKSWAARTSEAKREQLDHARKVRA